MTNCLQIARREESVGVNILILRFADFVSFAQLGCQQKKDFKWNDSWWENTCNNALSKLGNIIQVQFTAEMYLISLQKTNPAARIVENDQGETTSDDEPRTVRIKKALHQPAAGKKKKPVAEVEMDSSDEELLIAQEELKPKKVNKEVAMAKTSKQIVKGA